MTTDRDKLDGVEFFLSEIQEEAQYTVKSLPPKQDMVASFNVILHYVNTIKGIIQ